ncbi:hypothetical protein [Empedobacter tilapiae]|uniref:RHS repeat protein n=1 Tax=Empedobacter tilapiae TaxID=2491114 RepID=A0A4Z1B9D7_9FLAO|nr:hypothetical protein [Empedobacter tilapiae]TGN21630.1 hypothetical protein E4J94_17260 [Empedobacter tilapiae]
MKKNVVLLALLAFLVGIKNYGQDTNIIPIPTTPDAYALSKITDLEVDYFRGQANISIPIHSINIDGVNIPINLSYNTSGIKLNEVASSVGLGWSLNITGSINQDIKGQNDFKTPLYSKDFNDYDALNGGLAPIAENSGLRVKVGEILEGIYDTKPDLFSYNLPTSSGSFIKDDKKGIPIPYNNDQIVFNPDNTIDITDSAGNKYLFAKKNIVFTDNSAEGNLFKVTEIITPNNKKINFFYNKDFGYNDLLVYEKAHLRKIQQINQREQLRIPYECEEKNTANTEKLISKIETETEDIFFTYSNDTPSLYINGNPNRIDIDGLGIALRKIIVKDKQLKIIKEYTFNYEYFSNNNTPKTPEDYRLKLVNVYNNLDNTYHKFEYNETYQFPRRNSFNDDHWGYINSLNNTGKSNIPLTINYGIQYNQDDFVRINNKRDRSPNSIYTQIGSLSKITYPTGGYKVFKYENPIGEETKTASGYYGHRTYKTLEFNSEGYSEGTLQFTYQDLIEISKLAPDAEPYIEYNFDNTCKNNDTTPNHIQETMCFGYLNSQGKRIDGFDGPPKMGTIYGDLTRLFEGGVQLLDTSPEPCRCSIPLKLKYKYMIMFSTIPTYPGLRIKSISDYNANSTLENKREFKYGKYEDDEFKPFAYLDKPILYLNIAPKFKDKLYFDQQESFDIEEIITIHNSNQSANVYGSSKGIAYPYVIEYSKGGSTEYEFSLNNYYNLSNVFSLINSDYSDWKDGLLLNKKIKDEKSNLLEESNFKYNFNELRNDLTTFNTGMNAQKTAVSFSVNLDIAPKSLQYSPLPDDKTYFIKKTMNWINSASIENISVNNKKYFNNSSYVEENTSNIYSNKPNYFYLNSKTTQNSKGETLTTEYQYPPDLVGQEYYMKELTDANRIAEPVIVKQSVDGVYISEVHNQYNLFNGIIQKLAIHQKKGSNVFDGNNNRKITYDSYDEKGNLTQYTPENGIQVSIIWGYNGQYPVAKIEGSTFANATSKLANYLTKIQSGTLTAAEQSTIRTLIPDAMITTYTYKPLVGVTSITGPNGQTEYYNYDAANRLQDIRNDKQEVLKTFQYNYKQP